MNIKRQYKIIKIEERKEELKDVYLLKKLFQCYIYKNDNSKECVFNHGMVGTFKIVVPAT